MDVQLRKGILELCVLAALREKDSYGYQIIRDISQVVEISESTLYPILRRMELGGAVESYQIPYNNRLRKYIISPRRDSESLRILPRRKSS